jgi:hypothetical protein
LRPALLDSAYTLLLALRFLRADSSADSGQRTGKRDNLVGFLKIAFRDLFDEIRDIYINRAARNTRFMFAVQAAFRLVDCLLLGVSERYRQEVFSPYFRRLNRHLVLFG